MFISKYEKEALQEKVEKLSLLVTQASDRAQKAEEKILQMSLKISSIEEAHIQNRLKTVEVIEELQEIDGLSDEITEKITNFDSRVDEIETFLISHIGNFREIERELKELSSARKKDLSSFNKKFDDFSESHNAAIAKAREQIKMVFADQKMKYEKVLSIEKLLEITRGVLFGLKKEVSAGKKDFDSLCKIAVTRDEPVFALSADNESSKKPDVKERKTRSTKGIKLGPLIRTPEAPWGVKKDGTPRNRPGRASKTKTVSQITQEVTP